MITRLQLNRKYWIQGTAAEWDECVTSFEAAGIIAIDTIGNQVVIKMTPQAVEEYTQFFKGKKI